jgi:hypothetical protein
MFEAAGNTPRATAGKHVIVVARIPFAILENRFEIGIGGVNQQTQIFGVIFSDCF